MEASTHVGRARRRVPLVRRTRERARSLHPGVLVGGLVIAWAAVPLVALTVRVLLGDETPTGAYGNVPMDQLQYLAWIREAGDHGLISNLFAIAPSKHIFFHPVFSVSGILWKLGLPLQVAYWFWVPISLFAMLYGVHSYVRRLLPEGNGRWAAMVLVFFMAPPIVPLLDVFDVAIGAEPLALLRAFGYELTAGAFLWAYLPKAISVGLMPLVFLAVDRGVHSFGPARTRFLAFACAGGILVSWLHPWQGVTLILVLGGLLVWYRFALQKRPLIAVIAAASVPLLYYFALSRTNDDWATAALDLWPSLSPVAWVVAFLGFTPFLALAAIGLRRPHGIQEKILILWPIACVCTLLVPGAGWLYAPAGASIPLAILMVRGWQSLRKPAFLESRGLVTAVAVALVALVTIPPPLYYAKWFKQSVDRNWYAYYTDPGEHQALSYLEDSSEPGGVFTTPLYGAVVSSMTGRQTWSGHFAWTPNFFSREEFSRKLFGGYLSHKETRQLLQRTGATFVLTDCRFPQRIAESRLGNAVTPVKRFGCAGVYRINGAPGS
jgi:hypothetical protein